MQGYVDVYRFLWHWWSNPLPPTPSEAGTGTRRWAAHWEAAAKRRQAQMEDEEILAMLR